MHNEAALRRRSRGRPPRERLTVKQILAWAEAHQVRKGQRPRVQSGPIPEAPGETWAGINQALYGGRRGLPRSSLSRLLHQHWGDQLWTRRTLTVAQVLAWADAFKERTGYYPISKSGPVPEAPGLTWIALDSALRQGRHQLPAGSSLSRLLHEYRGLPYRRRPLTVSQVVLWAEAWKSRTGSYPAVRSGPIPEAPGLTWSAINQALRDGSHGLPRGLSLARILHERRREKLTPKAG